MTGVRDDLIASLVEAVARLNQRVESPLTPEQAQAIIEAWLMLHLAEMRGPPGTAREPTPEQIADAVAAWFALHSESLRGPPPAMNDITSAVRLWMALNEYRLRGTDGRAPTQAEINNAAAAWLERNRESLRGKDGRGVERMAITKFGDLIAFYTDGTSQNLGRVVGAEGGTTVMMGRGGGISEARVLELIEANAVSESSEVEHTHAAIHVTASGDTTVLTPASGKRISIVRLSALSDMDETDSPLIKIGFGASGGAIADEYARGAAVSMRQLKIGGVDQSVIVNLESAAKVDGTIIYDEVD